MSSFGEPFECRLFLLSVIVRCMLPFKGVFELRGRIPEKVLRCALQSALEARLVHARQRWSDHHRNILL